MWKYNFKFAFRNLINQKLASFLIIISLTIGLVTCILVVSHITYEKTFDHSFPGYKNIYRVTSDIFINGELKLSKPSCERALGETTVENHSDALKSGYLVRVSNPEYKIGENLFKNENIYHASPGFLDVFSIELVQGKQQDILNKPYTLIISESSAQKYFGNEDPIGKVMHKYPGFEYTIEGVFKDLPPKIHFQADMLLSFHDNMHLPPPLKAPWGESGYYTYISISEKGNIKELEKAINQMANKHKGNHFAKTNTIHKYHLQSIESIHLNSDLSNEIGNNRNGEYLNILLLVGLLIVVASTLNYLYFSVVKSIERASSTGIQKIVGATNKTINGLLLSESLIIHAIALTVSLLLSFSLSTLISEKWEVYFDFRFTNWILSGSVAGILIFSCLMNGLWPAISMNSRKSIDLLAAKSKTIHQKLTFRHILVSTQFVIVVGIIIGILGINKQVNFLINREKGLSIENKLVVHSPRNMRKTSQRFNNLNAFEQELLRHPNIENVTMGSAVPGNSVAYNFTISEEGKDNAGKAGLIIADKNFIKNYEIKLIYGTNFHEGSKACIINKTCLAQLGYENGDQVIGKILRMVDDSQMQDFKIKIVGVMEDFNFHTAKEKPGATILLDWTENMIWGNYTLSLNSGEYSNVIPYVKEIFESTFTNYPFEFFVLEDTYNSELKSEIQLLKMLKVFVLIALLLSMINLFSIAWHNASARTKEIGIRKVNGARVLEILTMLNKDFIKWVVVAIVLACPMAYYAMNTWLENFAYQTTLSWWLFGLAGIIALSVAILTVSWHSFKAATSNPVKALRYE